MPAPPSAPTTLSTLGATPPPAPAAPSPVTTKFGAQFYGFVEFDGSWDSTQSFNDLAGNANIARDGTYAAGHGRTIFSARNSRIGFKLKGPETQTVKTSGIVEGDFLGNQPAGSPTPVAGGPGGVTVSEGSFFTSPTFRMRHFALRVETPYIDVLAGQYWQLFGWQSMFHPNTVELQGVPGQIYSRSPQFRVSHAFKNDDMTLEIALAASRPPQRDSEVPDGQAGIRFVLNNFKALHTAGGTGTAVDGASIGLSTVGRYLRMPEFAASPKNTVNINGYGYSADLLLPIIPAKSVTDGNALTLTASFVYGQAIADLYTGLQRAGRASARCRTTRGRHRPTRRTSTTAWSASSRTRRSSRCTPSAGSRTSSARSTTSRRRSACGCRPTSRTCTRPTSTTWRPRPRRRAERRGAPTSCGTARTGRDANLFVDLNPAVRFGLEYAYFWQKYLDQTKGSNTRVQFSAFYIF